MHAYMYLITYNIKGLINFYIKVCKSLIVLYILISLCRVLTVMDQLVRNLLVLAVACSFSSRHAASLPYNMRSVTAETKAGLCPTTQGVVESIRQDIDSFINSSVFGTGPGYGACGCGGFGWIRAAYLDMSDPTQTCPPAWELITTPRRSCARPSNAGSRSCYSAMFPTQGIQYSQVCGRIIGYQFGQPSAFAASRWYTINDAYVDGVSLTYGSPRQHIWTFANELQEAPGYPSSYCLCTNSNHEQPITIIHIPFFYCQ